MPMQDTLGSTQRVRLGVAAEILGVHPVTVRRWANAGKIPSSRTAGGERRFLVRDLEAFLEREDRGTKAAS